MPAHPPPPKRSLPPRVAMAYQRECGPAIVEQSARRAINLIVWSAIQLVAYDATSDTPRISGGPDLACVANLSRALTHSNLPTLHFVSFGGWEAPHPNTTFGADAWWGALEAYNALAAAAGLAGGFDGIDWDIEGVNGGAGPGNTLSVDCLRLVTSLSERAKRAGMLVSMAPPQSYLDPSTSEFSLTLKHPARCYHPEFTYAGRNGYAALLALAAPGTYDLVSLQLYETYSLANCALTAHGENPGAYLRGLVERLGSGWRVDFELEPSLGLPNQTVSVAPSQLLIGLANGWAAPTGGKALYLSADTLWKAWSSSLESLSLRGFMFWVIKEEGRVVGGAPVYLSSVLNRMLRTRA